MIRMIRKLFLHSVTDKKVQAIQAESKKMLDDTAETARRHSELMKRNGFSLRLYIATGGDKHVH